MEQQQQKTRAPRRGDSHSSYNLQIRMTSDERDEIKRAAEGHGLTLSEYVRRRALGRPIVSRFDQATVAQCVKLGGLLKHIHNESGGIYAEQTAAILDEIRRTVRQLNDGYQCDTCGERLTQY